MSSDAKFTGSVPEIYDSQLVPFIFEPYASDLVARLRTAPRGRILEIAAGTGAVTRAMAAGLPESNAIVATDLNQAMMDRAAARGTSRPVTWRQADAMELPFEDGSFDTIVCQFGVMFYPDRPRAHAEARRVLKPGGTYLFNVWDRLQDNEVADIVTSALAAHFPDDPPRFLARTPYGYNDKQGIERDLATGGFTRPPTITTVTARSRGTAAQGAVSYCEGTPLRGEIEARDAAGLARATAVATEAIVKKLGRDPIDAKIQALVVSVTK
jgi:SAM-dependent methyltransferase